MKLEANPDTIVLYKPYTKHEYVVHYAGPLRMEPLDQSHAAKKNKYRIFLSGDRPWGKIRTEADSARRLAVIKDSYGNAFIPFLLPHYKEIIVIDPRQFNEPLLGFLEKQGIRKVLFLNNTETTTNQEFTELITASMKR
ncbi:DHHW family protein [Paenibacillus filicis]|uniref:DHHW family protein n=1 Tax=Paenibacillus gyeongsangnamensis TaxID=3388067 RepID=A0ABT4Q4G1_9BACL|nr:DHHW family protein [Paenibacillus filicis]MCZ8511763.1 DHHW family protein [Paenibacillus filicis]